MITMSSFAWHGSTGAVRIVNQAPVLRLKLVYPQFTHHHITGEARAGLWLCNAAAHLFIRLHGVP